MDFSNRQNRFVHIHEAPTDYLNRIYQSTQHDMYYPTYHIAPKHGLVNDPNGLYELNGEHHIFYQWFPLGPVHGLKHWYHLSTKDFIHYDDHGVALTPDQPYDEHGCFSGSTFVENKIPYIFYTGNKMVDGVAVQTQILATTDGKNITKQNVIIDNQDNHPSHEFRDPIVFKRNEEYIVLVGAQNLQTEASLELYRGPDFQHLNYHGNVSFSEQSVGFMLECPNYYEEDDKGIFIFSPQGLKGDNKYDFQNVFSVVYAIGSKIDIDALTFEHNGMLEVDKGFDFYAPQTYLDERGRRIMIGWLGNSKSAYPTDENRWAHMLTLPRELTIKNNILHQTVLAEFENLKDTSFTFNGKMALPSTQFKLEMMIEDTFELTLQNDNGDYITFKATETEFILDRSRMTHVYAEEFGTIRYAKRQLKQTQKIEMWYDNSSFEIFCDNGATVLTSRIFIEDLKFITTSSQADLFTLRPIQIPYKLK